jgi:predicted porin
MIDSSLRHSRRALSLAVALALGAASNVALADDAKGKSSTEAFVEQLVKGFYGTFDVSVDYSSKGMGGLVAYGYSSNGTLTQTSFPSTGQKGFATPYGRVGFMPEISTNKSGIGWRGSHAIAGSDTRLVMQIEASVGLTAAPGIKTSQFAQSNTVTGTLGSGDTFIGLAGKDWGAIKAGTTYAPYKKSTDRMNPFSGMLGDYAVVMGNTGGDNRVEFGTRLEHALWYESPSYDGFSYDILFSPGQNYTTDNTVQPSGQANCNGGNVPGSGNLPLNCDDGGFSDAMSMAFKYETKELYLVAAFELHKNVNRNSDGIGSNNPYYGIVASTLDPAWQTGGAVATASPGVYANFIAAGGTPPFISDIGNEAAYKFGAQYILPTGTTVSGIFERMTRKIPANLAYQNERQRNGFWLAVTQELDEASNLSFGWAHAGKTPGDPGGQHNYNPNDTNDTADLFTLAYKHKMDKQLYWYVNASETINHGNAHYDMGAGGRGITTDCHDATHTTVIDYSSAGNTTWGGCKPKGISLGLNYKF